MVGPQGQSLHVTLETPLINELWLLVCWAVALIMDIAYNEIVMNRARTALILEHTPPLHIHRARAALRSAVPPRRTLVRAASAGICAAPFVLALALALALLAAALDAVGEEARASADVDKGQAAVGRADGNVESELRLQTASPVRRNDHHC